MLKRRPTLHTRRPTGDLVSLCKHELEIFCASYHWACVWQSASLGLYIELLTLLLVTSVWLVSELFGFSIRPQHQCKIMQLLGHKW